MPWKNMTRGVDREMVTGFLIDNICCLVGVLCSAMEQWIIEACLMTFGNRPQLRSKRPVRTLTIVKAEGESGRKSYQR